MNDCFYRTFEERYYASREAIKALRMQYLPFVVPLSLAYPGGQTVDIGCGRGEWLELMVENGFKPHGLDLDAEMLKDCKELGLPAERGDGVVHLSSLSDESQVVVSAFHVVEHLSFEQLRTIVSQAFRVLKPGGLLIMETPNPENIVVATRNFYIDPTHNRPIPSQLLSFLPEYYGFMRVKTIRLQESKELIQKTPLTLYDVLNGVSPDYAIIAQKAGDEKTLSCLDNAFTSEHGLSQDSIVALYDDHLLNKIQNVADKAQEAYVKAGQAEAKAEQAKAIAELSEAKAEQADHALQLIYNSRSWRITAPLRWIGLQARLLYQYGLPKAEAFSRKIIKSSWIGIISFCITRPKLHSLCIGVLKTSGLYDPVRAMYYKISYQNGYQNANLKESSVAFLPPRAKRIYCNLKSAIEKEVKDLR